MYKRTVHCHYCYEKGHNKRTCPKFAETAKQNPDSYTAKNWAHMKEKKTRLCQYCKQEGHNTQTCESLSNDRIKAVLKNRDFRKDVLEKFKTLGIGLGTLFSLKKYDYSGNAADELILMVESIKWDNILYQNGDRSIIVNDHGETDLYHSFEVSTRFFEDLKNGKIVILNPASPEMIGVGIPDNWFSGITNLKQAFIWFRTSFEEVK